MSERLTNDTERKCRFCRKGFPLRELLTSGTSGMSQVRILRNSGCISCVAQRGSEGYRSLPNVLLEQDPSLGVEATDEAPKVQQEAVPATPALRVVRAHARTARPKRRDFMLEPDRGRSPRTRHGSKAARERVREPVPKAPARKRPVKPESFVYDANADTWQKDLERIWKAGLEVERITLVAHLDSHARTDDGRKRTWREQLQATQEAPARTQIKPDSEEGQRQLAERWLAALPDHLARCKAWQEDDAMVRASPGVFEGFPIEHPCPPSVVTVSDEVSEAVRVGILRGVIRHDGFVCDSEWRTPRDGDLGCRVWRNTDPTPPLRIPDPELGDEHRVYAQQWAERFDDKKRDPSGLDPVPVFRRLADQVALDVSPLSIMPTGAAAFDAEAEWASVLVQTIRSRRHEDQQIDFNDLNRIAAAAFGVLSDVASESP